MFSPSDETVEVVRAWLVGAGIMTERITHSDNRGWFAFDASTAELEGLVKADFHGWEHMGTGRVTAAADEYVGFSSSSCLSCWSPGCLVHWLGVGFRFFRRIFSSF